MELGRVGLDVGIEGGLYHRVELAGRQKLAGDVQWHTLGALGLFPEALEREQLMIDRGLEIALQTRATP